MAGSFWQGKKVLVAGGAGLIGSYLADQLVADGANVRVADNLESGSLDNLQASRKHIDFLNLDLRDPRACREATADREVVFDLAAKTVGIVYSGQHHGEMLCSTALISMNLLEAARQQGVRRYMVTSSSCVYPDGASVPTPEGQGHVGWPEKANEGYGWAKRLAEMQGRYYANEYGMELAVVRPANVYGPRYNWRQPHAHVIPALILRILGGEDPLVVWGSGRQTRSFIHASDAARAMQFVTERITDGEAINLGGEEVTVAELVRLLTELAGYHGEIVFDTTKPEGPARKFLSQERLLQVVPELRSPKPLRKGLEETMLAGRQFLGQVSHTAGASAG